jgi:hypothetical protein
MCQRRARLTRPGRWALFAVATMMSGAFLTFPATADEKRATAAHEAALRAAELARFEANVSADAKMLDALLDDDLEYVHSNGDVDGKRSFIESLTSGRRDYAATRADIESIRVLGDVAIIRGKAKVTVVDEGTSRDLHLGYTDVWVLRDGKWKMTAWRSARMPDSPVK